MGEFLGNLGEWSALLAGRHGAPGRLLGPQPLGVSGTGKPPSRRVRAFLPEACRAWVVQVTTDGQRVSRPMRRTHRAGIYEAVVQLPHAATSPPYLFRVDDRTQGIRELYDPYAFPTMLTDYDFHLLGEGRHWKSYEKLGAQLHSVDDVAGVNFAVWAPNSDAVSVVGDFNGWDGRTHQMHKRIPSGIWELFVPGIGVGTLYKFRVHHNGTHGDRSDPYGFAAELPPRTASQVVDLGSYQWRDDAWMARRAEANALSAPLSIYEVHLGSWRRPGDDPHRWLTYADLEIFRR